MRSTFSEFREIWLVDFEFQSFDGERRQPICLVAHELRSGQVLKLWQDDLLVYANHLIPSDAIAFL